jgi:general secretion pathway protein F
VTSAAINSDAAASFRYRAATDAGAIVEGVVRATSRDAALRELRRQQLWPVTVDAVIASRASTPWSVASSASARRREVARWTRTLATLVSAGAPMDRALNVAQSQATVPEFIRGAQAVRHAVQGGASLAEAMRQQPVFFDAMHTGVVDAGEAAGALDKSLDTLAGYLEEDESLRSQLQAALLYPALMGIVASLGILVLLLFVVPRFSTLLSDMGGTLPLSTRLLVGLGAVVTRGWWAFALVGAVAIVGVRSWLAAPGGMLRWHASRLSLPVIGSLERTMVTARFTRAMGLMLQGGLSLLPALRLAQSGVSNRAMAAELERASQRVARGDGLSASMNGILSPMAVQLLAVGEESGQLDTLALRAATVHDSEVRDKLRTAASLLEPALILAFGTVVGFVALAMLQAIYAVNAGL